MQTAHNAYVVYKATRVHVGGWAIRVPHGHCSRIAAPARQLQYHRGRPCLELGWSQ